MKTTIICLAAVAALTVNTYAEKDIDYSHLPTRVQQTIREYKGHGEVKKVKTKRLENGQTAYEVDYKERGDEKQILIGQDGVVIGDEQQLDKDRGKGKGKAKGHYKDKGKGKDKDRENEEEQAATPTPAAAPTPVPPPATPQPVTGSVQTTPPVATPTPAPAPPQSRPTGERAAAFERQVKAINTLGANEKALQAGLAAIAKESGVPVKMLQAQQAQYTVGPAGLLMANELARSTKRPAQQFLTERNSKAGWDAIAERNGVNPDLLLPKLQRLHRAMVEAMK